MPLANKNLAICLSLSSVLGLRFRRKLGPKGVARMYPVLLDVLRETHSLTYSVPPQRERSRPGRLLDTLIRRSRGQSKQSTEETKPVHSRDDHELLRGALKRMSSPQNITDMCNQIFKDLEKDKRQSTRPSSKATDPRNCSKQEQIIQELKREPSNKHCLHF
ncbi:uncharacterized protein LOC106394425 isoform X4 [Brassica napus]|nr:uncharacterized protein LOC106394425 isoform X4 [Brassica napus]